MPASRLAVTLLSNASATGTAVEWPGGWGRVETRGTFGGATLTLQVQDADGSTYHTVSAETTFSAAGTSAFFCEAGATIRIAVSGGTPSALYATAYRIV
jgi:hypothetical protein